MTGIIFAGIALLSWGIGDFLIQRSASHLKTIKWGNGVVYALLSTLAMGAANFLFGVGSRESHPLLVNWFTSAGMASVLFIYLVRTGKLALLKKDLEKHTSLILGVSIIDNGAWIAFAYSTLYIPIAISTGISESYIVLAALLGLLVNREKLKIHQFAGLVVTPRRCCFAGINTKIVSGIL